MTKTIITSYTAFLCLALVMAGAMTLEASEVTGTLSSDASNNVKTSGTLAGTVSSEVGGSSSGGSSNRGGGGGGSSTSRPAGSVLGAATSDAQTPSFPNAGVAPKELTGRVTIWSAVVTFLRSIVSL